MVGDRAMNAKGYTAKHQSPKMDDLVEEIRSTRKLITQPGAVIEVYTFELPERIKKEMTMALRHGPKSAGMPLDPDLIEEIEI